MFRAVSRRLALLNAIVVLAVLATVGTATYFYLSQRIETEIDDELASRATAFAQLWATDFSGGASSAVTGERSSNAQRSPERDEDDHHDEEDDRAEELIRSGDTIAYGFSGDGQLIGDLRGIAVPGLPIQNSIETALSGKTTSETIEVDGDQIRVFSTPVIDEGEVIGAVQVGMGLGPSLEMLTFIRRATFGGLFLGAILALPSGLFLATRSMRPIRHAFERQQAFVADASHELRTPLTLIRAEAEYLQQTPSLTHAERRDGEQRIVDEVDSMTSLVGNLLLLARSDGSSVPLDKEPLDLSAVAAVAADRFEELAKVRGVSLMLAAGETVTVYADRRAIEQALNVLIDNALSYTPTGGTVEVTARRTPGAGELSVRDTGIGIESKDLDRIFERFYRADKARSRATGGAGLGLSIAKSLVTAHGGNVRVESRPGEGSMFTISLPTRSS